MTEEKCSNCRFYDKKEQRTYTSQSDEKLHEDDFEAGCRRYPPSRINVFGGDFVEAEVLCDFFDFPTVKSDNWCGEWQPAKAKEIKRVDISAITTLSGRDLAALRADGFLFVDQIQSATNHDLMKIPNFGRLSLKRIRDWQAEQVTT